MRSGFTRLTIIKELFRHTLAERRQSLFAPPKMKNIPRGTPTRTRRIYHGSVKNPARNKCPADGGTLRVSLPTKNKNKRITSKSAVKKVTPMNKAIKKRLAKKKAPPKKAQMKMKAGGKKTTSGKTASAPKKQVREKSHSVDTVAFAPEGLGPRSGEQSGDLQGLSNVEGADSQSVDELLEEGNAFEADVVKGVEDAGDADQEEVRTHEVPQDDVPDEYKKIKSSE
jgi:hypothetical protein